MTPLLRSVAGYLVAIAVAMAALQFVVNFSGRGRAARAHVAVLQKQIAETRELAAQRKATIEQIAHAQKYLAGVDLSAIAPHNDAFSWARAQVSRAARECEIEVLAISESSDLPPPPGKESNGPMLIPFRLSMELKGSPEASIRFVRRIEEMSRYVQIHHFSILALRAEEPPAIFATAEWPAWPSKKKMDQLQNLVEAARAEHR